MYKTNKKQNKDEWNHLMSFTFEGEFLKISVDLQLH
jgi:hypothetical protein